MTRAARLALCILLALGPVAGQVQTLRVPAFPGQPADEQVSIEITPVFAAHDRPGPGGFVTCIVENPDERSHATTIHVTDWARRLDVHETLHLEPGQRVVRHYPVQRFGQGMSVLARVDDGETRMSNAFAGKGNEVAVLFVTERAESIGTLQTALARALPASGAPAPRRGVAARPLNLETAGIVHTGPDALPSDWRCFAGFDLLVVDGRARLDPHSEQALVEVLAAGGRVYVPYARGLPEGPLRRTLGEHRQGAFAFGRFLVDPEKPDATGLAEWLRDTGVADTRKRIAGGPAHDWLHASLKIPGLGDVPVFAFFILLTAFVVVAGPVNVFLCRRAGRPVLIAFTLPALGIGFAAAILLWGVLAEGLGVRGAVRSLTWLDQRTHVAVCHAGMSLYPGLTPSELVPHPGTLVTSLALRRSPREETPHRLVVDHAAGGRIAGSLVPARWQTHVVSVSVRQARERLRFRRVADGALEVLFDRSLVPVAPGIAVRDHAGDFWFGVPEGERVVLQRSDAAAVHAFLHRGRMELQTMATTVNELELRYAAQAPGDGARAGFAEELRHLASELLPGSFAGWLAASAAFDQLGLDVAWEDRRHFVIGLLAEEDFVD
ncbi:MAG TPA: hypothetical protein VK081_03210 [Planctomycetota bacterium]|nr:hypothetical protein [Planctomycetota bacterium]